MDEPPCLLDVISDPEALSHFLDASQDDAEVVDITNGRVGSDPSHVCGTVPVYSIASSVQVATQPVAASSIGHATTLQLSSAQSFPGSPALYTGESQLLQVTQRQQQLLTSSSLSTVPSPMPLQPSQLVLPSSFSQSPSTITRIAPAIATTESAGMQIVHGAQQSQQLLQIQQKQLPSVTATGNSITLPKNRMTDEVTQNNQTLGNLLNVGPASSGTESVSSATASGLNLLQGIQGVAPTAPVNVQGTLIQTSLGSQLVIQGQPCLSGQLNLGDIQSLQKLPNSQSLQIRPNQLVQTPNQNHIVNTVRNIVPNESNTAKVQVNNLSLNQEGKLVSNESQVTLLNQQSVQQQQVLIQKPGGGAVVWKTVSVPNTVNPTATNSQAQPTFYINPSLSQSQNIPNSQVQIIGQLPKPQVLGQSQVFGNVALAAQNPPIGNIGTVQIQGQPAPVMNVLNLQHEKNPNVTINLNAQNVNVQSLENLNLQPVKGLQNLNFVNQQGQPVQIGGAQITGGAGTPAVALSAQHFRQIQQIAQTIQNQQNSTSASSVTVTNPSPAQNTIWPNQSLQVETPAKIPVSSHVGANNSQGRLTPSGLQFINPVKSPHSSQTVQNISRSTGGNVTVQLNSVQTSHQSLLPRPSLGSGPGQQLPPVTLNTLQEQQKASQMAVPRVMTSYYQTTANTELSLARSSPLSSINIHPSTVQTVSSTNVPTSCSSVFGNIRPQGNVIQVPPPTSAQIQLPKPNQVHRATTSSSVSLPLQQQTRLNVSKFQTNTSGSHQNAVQAVELTPEKRNQLDLVQKEIKNLLNAKSRTADQQRKLQKLVEAQQSILLEGKRQAELTRQRLIQKQTIQTPVKPQQQPTVIFTKMPQHSTTTISSSSTSQSQGALTGIKVLTLSGGTTVNIQSAVNSKQSQPVHPVISAQQSSTVPHILPAVTSASSTSTPLFQVQPLTTSTATGSTTTFTTATTASASVSPSKIGFPHISQQPITNILQLPVHIREKLQSHIAKLPQEQQELFYKNQSNVLQRLQQQLSKHYRPAPPVQTAPAVTQQNNVPLTVQQANQVLPRELMKSVATPASVAIRAKTLTPPLLPSKSQIISRQLSRDQTDALNPDYTTPFSGRKDCFRRLLRFHVFQNRDMSPAELEKVDAEYEEHSKALLNKSSRMLTKFHYLLLKESMRTRPKVETVMLERMFLSDERHNLEADRKLAKESPEEFVPRPILSPTRPIKTEPPFLVKEETSASDEPFGQHPVKIKTEPVDTETSIEESTFPNSASPARVPKMEIDPELINIKTEPPDPDPPSGSYTLHRSGALKMVFKSSPKHMKSPADLSEPLLEDTQSCGDVADETTVCSKSKKLRLDDLVDVESSIANELTDPSKAAMDATYSNKFEEFVRSQSTTKTNKSSQDDSVAERSGSSRSAVVEVEPVDVSIEHLHTEIKSADFASPDETTEVGRDLKNKSNTFHHDLAAGYEGDLETETEDQSDMEDGDDLGGYPQVNDLFGTLHPSGLVNILDFTDDPLKEEMDSAINSILSLSHLGGPEDMDDLPGTEEEDTEAEVSEQYQSDLDAAVKSILM